MAQSPQATPPASGLSNQGPRRRHRPEEPPLRGWQLAVYEVIFEADTRSGKVFDVVLLAAILLSILTVVLESVTWIREAWGTILVGLEWFFTLLFTCEYILRLAAVRYPARYATSFFGLVDLIAIAPSYVSLLFPGGQTLLVVRAFRLVRLFRIFKLTRYLGEARVLVRALRASRFKITVFLVMVLSLVLSVGASMYLIEGPESGFTSIPQGVYWAVVTMTTVGYGDIVPRTTLGQILASTLMILGYGIIAVPTGIVSVELAQARNLNPEPIACQGCGADLHDIDARYCKHCGTRLQTGNPA